MPDKLTKKERDIEFTTLDENEEIIERGRRAAYKENNKAEKRLNATTALIMGGMYGILRRNKYKTSKKLKKDVRKLFKGLNKQVTPIADDLDDAIKVVTNKTAKTHAEALAYTVQSDLIDKAIKGTRIGKLSSKLHHGNILARDQFYKTLSKGIRAGEGAAKLARKLTKIDDIIAGKIDLPKHIKAIERALMKAARINDPIEKAAQLRAVRKILKQNRQYIDDLTRAGAEGFQHLGIRGATKRFAKGAEALINDVDKLNENNINLIVGRWRKSKVRYYQTRVTRTETNKRYAEYNRSHWGGLKEEGIVVGVDVLLSDSHPEFDICDELQGRYTDIANAPLAPHHTNCICRNQAVLKDDVRKDAGLSANRPFRRGVFGNGRVEFKIKKAA